MNYARSLLSALAIGAITQTAWSADAAAHPGHHPAGETATAAAKATEGTPRTTMKRMDAQMKAMGAAHDRMMAAKTPEERNALMPEHMKAMQAGMAMMDGPASLGMQGGKGGMAAHHQTMEKRMEMMHATMQLMMDRLPAASVN